MPKVLILSSDTGEGHNSAAAAIESAARSAGLHPKVRKPLEESTAINRSLGNVYNTLLRHRPQWVAWYFRLIERARPNERDIFYSKVRGYIGRFIESENPDIVLSVHPMLNHFIQRYIKEERLPIPCYTFLTDPFPPFWRGWASPFVDRYFVATDEALQALTAAGIPAWHIEQVAMPVRRGFRPATMTEIQEFRATFKLDGASTILINGGARGGGPLSQIYKTIRRAAPNSNILVVCGRNEKLRWRIERFRDPRTRTFGFVDDLHRYVGASDLVVTKPGALSTYEALACGVPVLLAGIHGLMPQETGFFQAARHYGFGFSAGTFGELEAAIKEGPGAWHRKRESVSDFYKHNSGEELIERIHCADVRA
jgi:UDP-N-acetylglucosamine:LPS N-acetylglucosamine transferase